MSPLTNLILIIIFISSEAFNTNFEIKKFQLCNATQGLIRLTGNVTKEGDDYYASGGVMVPVPLGDDIGMTIKIESKVANVYVELFTIREKSFCKSGNIYGGEFWYDLQRAAQMFPGQCPIQARRYEIHHTLLDFRKISLQTFPFGLLRFTCKIIENSNPDKNLLCLLIEVENIPN